jgi:hypothetical protein
MDSQITQRTIYHTALLLLSVFCLWPGAATALEEKSLTDVFPVGQRQQYLYYTNGSLAGESWLTVEEVPKTRDRYVMHTTIDVDGVPFGSRMKLKGFARAELDTWGRPISYESELVRPAGTTRIETLFNYPLAEMIIDVDGETRETVPRYHEDSRLLDFVFIAPFDIAFRLDPVHPSATKVRRNYFVPHLEVNVYTDFEVAFEETITLEDGTEVPTVKVTCIALLTNVWLDPKGRVVKAEVPSEALEIRFGETIEP